MKLEEIATAASMLDDEAKASLASRLIRSLSPPAHDVEDKEVFERMQEAEKDPSAMLTHQQFVDGIHRNAD